MPEQEPARLARSSEAEECRQWEVVELRYWPENWGGWGSGPGRISLVERLLSGEDWEVCASPNRRVAYDGPSDSRSHTAISTPQRSIDGATKTGTHPYAIPQCLLDDVSPRR